MDGAVARQVDGPEPEHVRPRLERDPRKVAETVVHLPRPDQLAVLVGADVDERLLAGVVVELEVLAPAAEVGDRDSGRGAVDQDVGGHRDRSAGAEQVDRQPVGPLGEALLPIAGAVPEHGHPALRIGAVGDEVAHGLAGVVDDRQRDPLGRAQQEAEAPLAHAQRAAGALGRDEHVHLGGAHRRVPELELLRS